MIEGVHWGHVWENNCNKDRSISRFMCSRNGGKEPRCSVRQLLIANDEHEHGKRCWGKCCYVFMCVRWGCLGVNGGEQFAWDWCTAYCSASRTTWLSSLYVCYWAAVGAALSAAHPLSRVNVEKLKAAKSWYSCTFMEICILFGKKCQKKKLVPPVFVDSRRTSCLSYLLCFPWLWQSLQHSCCPGSREPSKLD